MSNTITDLKLAIYHTICDYPGGLKSMSALYGWVYNTLAQKTNPNITGTWLNAKEIEEVVMAAQGDFRIAHAVAALSGGVFCPLKSVDFGLPGAQLEQVHAVLDEVMDVITEFKNATKDGRIRKHEFLKIKKEVADAVGILKALELSAEQQVVS